MRSRRSVVSLRSISRTDEAGPNLARIADRFGSQLHAPAAELDAIAKHARVDVAIEATRHVDASGVEILPTPGHSVGSTCYFVSGVGGERYLFTGDTTFPTDEGSWSTFLVPGRGHAEAMRESIAMLGTLAPDIVLSSAFGGDAGYEVVDERRWAECISQALASVPA
jgi:hydroxyacylglutathione hydrolase